MTVNFGDLGNLNGALALVNAGASPINAAVKNALNNGQPARGIKLKIYISGAPTGTTPTMTVTIQGVDIVSGQKWTILASVALNAAGFTVLTVYPGAAVSSNVSANDEIPANLNINVAFGGTTPVFNGTIDVELLP
ncbi:MAG TPA: hypothetical protein VGH91_04545 [Gammaproteobacteria bacterium]|jgi:hypothetical protein